MDQKEWININNQYYPTIAVQQQPYKPKRVWINGLLFLATILTTLLMGAHFLGHTWGEIMQNPSLLLTAWEYSFSLLLILTCHEMGHYVAARWHRLNVTLPYYIPLPFEGLFHFGTMGAFIKIKSPIPNRRALLDVGIAGPLAGLVVSLAVLTIGYLRLPDLGGIIAHVEEIHPWVEDPGFPTITMGKSLLIIFFNDIVGQGLLPMSEIYHFPLLFSGWIGLFVTAMNLMPIGQLDGGHIVYSLLGARAKIVNFIAFGGLFLLVILLFSFHGVGGFIWIPWMIILTIIGLRHPPTIDDSLQLTPGRRYLGWLCVLIFILCFIPLPIYIQI